MRVYKVEKGGLHERFQASRAKVQIFGGGFGNGKTTGAIIKTLQIARDYPGANILIARSTYPKLNDTIRKEFINWCPPSWIKRKNLSQENVVELTNGTVINFRYIAQGGKSGESSTSNLLSATYDLVVVDQVEDPEIVEKDFLDLLGRLRGSTPYQGDDETMPSSGPRWVILMCNPTRNWVYRKLVKPLQDYAIGIINPDLLWDEDAGRPMVELFEGSTYENAANLPADFIKTQEASYKGQMKERFLLGKWGAYEGLVYPDYDPQVHMLDHDLMLNYFQQLVGFGSYGNIIEAYDHGIAQYACYGFAFTDHYGNVFILDGYYEKEKTIRFLADSIKGIRKEYGYEEDQFGSNDDSNSAVLADPAVFRRTSGNSQTVGTTVAGLFADNGIKMRRANNDILAGIAKVQSYLYIDPSHPHPILEGQHGPRLYISKKLTFLDAEFADYYWKKNNVTGDNEDAPIDRNDHAMDMVKYLMTYRPRVASFHMPKLAVPKKYRQWRERGEANPNSRKHRYG
jgi:PBSX family phage terminase large subunit